MRQPLPFPCFFVDEVTRDYAYGEKDSLIRKCRLLPWITADLTDVPYKTPLFLDKHYEVIIIRLLCWLIWLHTTIDLH